nr:MAG TPA: hypothetical protein [Caudoviricetes sp.]
MHCNILYLILYYSLTLLHTSFSSTSLTCHRLTVALKKRVIII